MAACLASHIQLYISSSTYPALHIQLNIPSSTYPALHIWLYITTPHRPSSATAFKTDSVRTSNQQRLSAGNLIVYSRVPPCAKERRPTVCRRELIVEKSRREEPARGAYQKSLRKEPTKGARVPATRHSKRANDRRVRRQASGDPSSGSN